MSRMYSPSPTVRASRVPLYQRGQRGQRRGHLRGLGQDYWASDSLDVTYGEGGGGGGYDPSYYDPSYYDPSYYDPSYYDPSQYDAQAAADAAAAGSMAETEAYAQMAQDAASVGMSLGDEMPGTGLTAAELMAYGYTADDLGTMLSTEVAGTGQTVGELMAIGYTADDINTMLATSASQLTPFIPPTPTSAGKSTATVPSGGASSGGSSGAAPKAAATTPTTPKPSPTVASTPTLTSLTSWFTKQTLIKGIPNWAVGAGGILGAMILTGGSSAPAGRKR